VTLDAIGIVSDDPTRAVAFYQLLGIELVKHSPDAEHYDASLPSGLRLMVDSVALIKSFDPAFEKTRGTGPVLCFKQGSAAAVNALYDQITRAGHRGIKAPWDAFWGQRYACVADPDGNQIDLFAPL
jgi:catechol 2,3-dioxygenase-like lactoylglutathione lyase family enzyme